MKDELKGFEDRNNDWLAQEMRREAKLSAWNVDDAKVIKEDHARIHSAEKVQYRINTNRAISNRPVGNQNQLTLAEICFMIIFVLFMFLMFLF